MCQFTNQYNAKDIQWETWWRNCKQKVSVAGRHFVQCRACGYRITLDTVDDRDD